MSADLHELVTLYMLDSLPENERDNYEQHLGECTGCVRELRSYEDTIAHLCAAVETQPPPALRRSVMNEVALLQQAGEVRKSRPEKRRRPGSTVVVVTMMLLVLVVVGAGAFIATLWQRMNDLERETEAATFAEREMSVVLAADDTRVIRIEGDVVGDLRLLYSESLDRALVVANGLELPSDDRTYQLWLVRGEEAASAGVLTPADNMGVVADLVGLVGVNAVAVSIEPAGGSDAPTGSIVALGLL